MNGFHPTIKELTANDKIIRYLKEKKQFEIVSNKKYYMGWAMMLFFASVLLFASLSLPLLFWSIVAGCISLIIPVLFVLSGIRFYYLAGNDDRKIIIDGTKRVMMYNTSLAIPFQSIKQFSVSRADVLTIKNKIRIKKMQGFRIDAEDHKGNKALILQSENEEKIRLIAKEISLFTGAAQKFK